jgi:serine/threonine protein kinase
LEYRFTKKLGEGTFGIVYLMEVRSGGKNIELAAKVPKDGTPKADVENEISHLERLKSNPFIMTYYGTVSSTSNQKIILTELMNSDLKGYKKPLTQKNIVDLFEGLSRLERDKTVHNDIKPANLFIDRDGNLKIGDVGGASYGKLGTTSTAEFSPPERFAKEHGNIYKSDVYSAGVSLWRMLKKKEAMDLPVLTNEKKMLDKGISEAIADNEPLSENDIDLIKSQSILSKVANDRFSLAKAIREDLDRSKPVEALIYKAIDPDNAKRPTAAQMAQDFKALPSWVFNVR